jgi:hypothetical protein
MKAITSFKGKHSFLSNFHPCTVDFGGLIYPSSEHAYMAAKSLDPDVKHQVARLSDGKAAKRFGKTIDIRPDWDEIKVEYMSRIVRRKFEDRGLAERLLATGDAHLIEGNYWHDQHWGSCTCAKHRGVSGDNWLGRILMTVRDEIRA